jgi:class 3 adenylate cyclase/tetratricopeptide (TPR) repeat protein
VAPEAAPERAPRDYTPRHLADRILASKAALEGERKQVTVLFADVRRSTELASAVDAEDWHGILDGFFTHLADGIHRFEGTVNQYTGDGIMALFGAPLAHEDHAQRACWAALHLIDTLRRYAREVKRKHGVDFAVRIGLNSGDVVVGKIGDDLRMDYTAQGATVHLAARMESLAEAGQAYLAPETARLAGPYFELEDLGEFTIRGTDAPVRVHELRGEGEARTRFDVSLARGLSRFVGRDSEVKTLDAALAQAHSGNGQVVGVVADAGTGKSRLCFEFAERCRAGGMRVLQGSCVAHGKNLPLLPILQVIRGYFEIGERDDPRQAREKIAGRMLLLDEAYRDELPLLFELLGVPDPERPASPLPPEARQRRLFGVLRSLVQAGPQPGQNAGIVMIEDLHWIDEGSDAWVAEWVEATAGAPNLLLLNFRPEYRAAWMQRAHYQQIALAPLSAEAIRDLLSQLLGNHASTEGLAERIHAHTAGNPFFAEEVVQALIESGQLEGTPGAYRLTGSLERIDVPPSVHAVLAARIDRLAEREKRVLQVASVIGKDFDEPLLASVSEFAERELADALATLRSAEYVHQLALYPVAQYTFKHPLTQEVAHDSLLRERRRAIHAAVAKAIEARSTDLEEDAALLAHHYEAAGDAVTASRWHLRAADWIGPNDVYASSRHARAVLALLGEQEEVDGSAALLAQACARLVGLGWRLGMEDAAARLYADGRRWAQAAGDLDAEARVAGSYAAVLAVAGRLEESAEAGDVFNRLAEELGDAELRAVAYAWMTFPPMRMGRLEEAERRILDGIREGERQPDLGMHFLGISIKGFMLQWLTEIHSLTRPWPEVEQDLDRAVRWSRARSEVETECYALAMIRYLSSGAGKAEAHLPRARQALAAAEGLGAPLARVYAKVALATCLLDSGKPGEALELLDEALLESRETRTGLDDEPEGLRTRARALLALGRGAEALASAREALAVCEDNKLGMYVPDVLRDLASALLGNGDLDGAADALDRAEREARAIGAVNVLPLVTWTRAELAGRRGDAGAQRTLLEEALEGLRERGATGHVETVSRALEALGS